MMPASMEPISGRKTTRISSMNPQSALHHVDVLDGDGAAVAEEDHQDRAQQAGRVADGERHGPVAEGEREAVPPPGEAGAEEEEAVDGEGRQVGEMRNFFTFLHFHIFNIGAGEYGGEGKAMPISVQLRKKHPFFISGRFTETLIFFKIKLFLELKSKLRFFRKKYFS